MPDNPHFDWELIRRYDTRGPRYTSYPTALQFSDRFTVMDYEEQVRISDAADDPRPLSVYLHIPFCEHLCFYCACNKVATRNRGRAAEYLEYLLREIDLKAGLLRPGRRVEQIHLGGGTPTFLSPEQLASVLDRLESWFSFADDERGDYSIEIDPRTVTADYMHQLRELGFNRVSLGVQDFDERVQQAVHRIQPREQTLSILGASREAGIRSINVDLIYGLALQTVASMEETLDAVLGAAPDRISLFNYAHLPERFPAQRRIRTEDLPDAAEKLDMLQTSVERIADAGYVHIGMDHFALPEDELAVAKIDGTLHRNFQGYTTHSECELVGFGVSSIGHIGRCFSQNAHGIEEYKAYIDRQQLPIVKGLVLNDDDVLRAHVINKLMCFGILDMPRVEGRFNVDFVDYFKSEMDGLAGFIDDGLLQINRDRITVTDRGRMLVRNICATFDHYLPAHQPERFSRTI